MTDYNRTGCDHAAEDHERRLGDRIYCHECEEYVRYSTSTSTYDVRDTAVVLAEQTGRPKEDFECDFDEYSLPEPSELVEVDLADADDINDAFLSDGDPE